MAEEIQQDVPDAGNIPPSPEPAPARRKRRKRVLQVSQEQINTILDDFEKDLNRRDHRIRMRETRYAKYRGWHVLEPKTFPWKNCAHYWVPIMQIGARRLEAVLENAVKGIRPVMQAKARQGRNSSKGDRIDKLLDYQFFSENKGEEKIDSAVSNFVEDEALFFFCHWVRDDQTIREIRILPPLDPAIDHIPQILSLIPKMFEWPNINFGNATAVGKDSALGWIWDVEFPGTDGVKREIRVEFYERDDEKLEAVLTYEARTFDGPAIEILDFEDVVPSSRAANLQPKCAANPLGASSVSRICKISLDAIRRGRKSGLYDRLDDTGMEAIEHGKSPVGSGAVEESTKELKDKMEGSEIGGFGRDDETSRQVIEWYGGLDVDNDKLEEQVILWIERKSKTLLKAVMLTELYPGVPLLRPIISTSIFPITNRIYGISFIELLEQFQDQIELLMDQNMDWGTICNSPWGAYRASSGLEGQPLYMEPGEFISLDNPQQDLYMPQFPQRGETHTINTISLLQQFIERMQMFSDFSFGRVPAGKASALRTMGTTMSLLGQADVRSEQVLRRFFSGLARVYEIMHRLNQHFLPDKKEIRVLGMVEKGQDAYLELKPLDIDADMDFEFKATMLNTNKQMLSQALNQIAAMMMSPLAIQAGIVTEEQIYNVLRDEARALDLPDNRYMQPPPQTFQGPKILAEEAISAIMANELPVGRPLEGAMQHYQKLVQFTTGDQFGHLSPPQVPLFKTWLIQVQQMITEEQQRQQMMQAAAQMQQSMGGSGGGPQTATGENIGTQQNPAVQPGEHIDESIGSVQ